MNPMDEMDPMDQARDTRATGEEQGISQNAPPQDHLQTPDSGLQTGRLQPLKICLTCSHGGHLFEMLDLLEAFEGHEVFYFCYDAETTRRLPRAYLVPNMAKNPVELVKNVVRVARIFWKERPDMIVSTGAEIALPVVFVGKVFGTKVLYVECGAQVTEPSFTGRIMARVADWFYVQWPELRKVYGPRAIFEGSLVDEARNADRF